MANIFKRWAWAWFSWLYYLEDLGSHGYYRVFSWVIPGGTQTDGKVLMCWARLVRRICPSELCNKTATPTSTPWLLQDVGILAISAGVRKRHGQPDGCCLISKKLKHFWTSYTYCTRKIRFVKKRRTWNRRVFLDCLGVEGRGGKEGNHPPTEKIKTAIPKPRGGTP